MNKQLEIPCLGRLFDLGMLYNCYTDELLPVWGLNQNSLKLAQVSQELSGIKCEITTEDTLQTKLASLGITEDHKLSVLSGMVKVSGAAEYIKDQKLSDHHCRVTLKYSTKTLEKKLPINELSSEELDDKYATHLVVGITYGAEAYFVFDDHESSKDIQERLSYMKTDIELITGTRSAEVANAKEYHCKYYGDFPLASPPSNYREATEVYKQLSKSHTSTPKVAVLYPISAIKGNPEQTIHSIPASIISRVEEIVDSLQRAKVKCKDLQMADSCWKFTGISNQISTFASMLDGIQTDFNKKISNLVPEVRKSEEKETKLKDLLSSIEKSPFCSVCLENFLARKTKEHRHLTQYLRNIKEVPKIKLDFDDQISEDALDSLITNISISHVICFGFNLTTETPAYLLMAASYRLEQTDFPFSKTSLIDPDHGEEEWFDKSAMQLNLRSKLSQFVNFAKENSNSEKIAFVVKECTGRNENEPDIVLYNEGEAVSIYPPGQPGTPTVVSKTHYSISLEWTEPERGAAYIQYYKIECIKVSSKSSTFFHTKDNKGNFCVEQLAQGKQYQFKVQAVTAFGKSTQSDACTETTDAACALM